MLRNYLGNDVFYKGLNIYLKQNAFGNGEAQQLRLALEQASGLDLNWYFNQWYYSPGHPELDIKYKWDEVSHTQTVYLQQTQAGDGFKLPFAVDIYAGGKKERHKVWMNDKTDTLTFSVATKPDLVNVDGDKILLAKKTDHKTLDEFAFQYANAPLYLDRFEAISAAQKEPANKTAQQIILAALKDKYFELRATAIASLNLTDADVKTAALPVLSNIIKTDEKTTVQAAALNALVKLKNPANVPLFKQTINSQSYAVQAASLNGIALAEPDNALKIAKGLESDTKAPLTAAVVNIYAKYGGDAEFPFVAKTFNSAGVNDKFMMIRGYIALLGKVNNTAAIKESMESFKDLAVKYKQFGIGAFLVSQLSPIKFAKDNAAKAATGDAKTQLEIQSKVVSDTIDAINKI
jgi:aminopeptidase N